MDDSLKIQLAGTIVITAGALCFVACATYNEMKATKAYLDYLETQKQASVLVGISALDDHVEKHDGCRRNCSPFYGTVNPNERKE